MNDFFSKLENFFFDILGLILPGAIFLLILLSPVLFVDIDKMEKIAGSSVLLSALTTIWNILKNYWSSYPKSVLTITAIIAYLIGHTVKVISIIKYDFLKAFFDEFLNKGIIHLYDKARKRIFPPKKSPSKRYLVLSNLFRPFKTILDNIFTFGPPNLPKQDGSIKQNCLHQLDTRLNTRLPDDEYSTVKIASVIANQENLRSLGTFFLAKYNLYRSLALIFLFTTFYYNWFLKTAGNDNLLSTTSREISGLILWAPVILWFTFHVKYKRYWTLYGGERLMTLFYFLNKKEIDERG